MLSRLLFAIFFFTDTTTSSINFYISYNHIYLCGYRAFLREIWAYIYLIRARIGSARKPSRINFIFQFHPAVEGKATLALVGNVPFCVLHIVVYAYSPLPMYNVGGSAALLYDYVCASFEPDRQ